MAEDFFNAFQLGTGILRSVCRILPVSASRRIKELDQRTTELRQKTSEVEQLRDQVNQLRQSNGEMERRIATLEQLLLGQLQLQQTSTLKLN